MLYCEVARAAIASVSAGLPAGYPPAYPLSA